VKVQWREAKEGERIGRLMERAKKEERGEREGKREGRAASQLLRVGTVNYK